MEFWATQPQAWAEATARPRCPATVMNEYVDWLAELGGVPVFVGFPAVFDFGFVNHYLLRYCGQSVPAQRGRHPLVRYGRTGAWVAPDQTVEYASTMDQWLEA